MPIRTLGIGHNHNREVVSHATLAVGNPQDFTVAAGLRIGPLDRGPLGRGPVGHPPLERGDLARRAPRFRAVEFDAFAGPDEMMGAGHGHQLRLELPEVRLTEERIPLLRPPLAGGLTRDNLIVQVRPSAAAAFLSKQPHPVPL